MTGARSVGQAESARPDIFLSFLLTERKESDIFVI